MKIIITGSLGNVAKPLIRQLILEGHELTVISSDETKRSAIRSLGSTPAIGSILDTAFLKKTFEGADSVFLMTPPALGENNLIANTIQVGKNYAAAVAETGVPRLVMLSSVGADVPVENGPIAGLHHIEKCYADLNVSATFLRAGNFYINLFNDIPLIKSAGIIGGNYPAGTTIPMVHPEDIAAAAARELVKTSADQQIHYVVSDNRAAGDIAKVLGAAIGKPGLPWVEFTDQQAFAGMVQAGLPEEMARLYEEMGRGIRNGVVQKDFVESGAPIYGKIRLEDFARAFVDQFNA